MTHPGIPEHVRRFIESYIDSVEQLEVLALLQQHPEREWTGADAAGALYSHPSSVALRLASLHDSGLLWRGGDGEPRYRYAPRTDVLDATAVQLIATYKERRVAVISFIASRPMANVRAFSEAFRIRKKED